VARSGDAAVTVLLGVSRRSNDRRQEWHENRRRDQNSRYSMCFTKTVLSDRIAEFQVKSLVALMGMLPRAPRSKNRIGLSLKGPATPPWPSRVSADPAENEPARNGTRLRGSSVARMATRQERLDAFVHEGDPPADQPLELLCEDHVGTYVIPFPCRWTGDYWQSMGTAERVQVTVIGWRRRRETGEE
jgi:hypothetical protein